MNSSGRTYEISGDTTEWEDILIKKGITTNEEVLLGKGLNPADVSFRNVQYIFYGICVRILLAQQVLC